MPPDAASRTAAGEWLRHAESNLALAREPKPEGVLWEHLCFNAQQAAEKAVKAVLVFHRIEFPKTHEIGNLLALFRDAGHPVPEALWRAATLSPYAITSRYPGAPPVEPEEYQHAVRLAAAVVRWAEEVVHGV